VDAVLLGVYASGQAILAIIAAVAAAVGRDVGLEAVSTHA